MKSLLNVSRFICYFYLVLVPFVNALEFNPADFSAYHIDIMNDGSVYTLYSEEGGDRLYIINSKGKQILAAKNLTIDGYSTFDKIVAMPNLAKGFSIINRGSSWGGEFRYDVKWYNNQFMLVDQGDRMSD